MKSEFSSSMLERFLQRTQEHINRVGQNLEKVARHPDYQGSAILLMERASKHDASKFKEPERTPKIWGIEYTRCKSASEPFQYPEGMEAQIDDAELHHLTTNSHHPEYHFTPDSMSDLDIIEMVCDWTAIAQARNECGGSARCWAEKCIGSTYSFNAKNRGLVYGIIDILDS